MQKKKVLITGASRGIGKAIADLLVREGYEVIGTSRKPEAVQDGDTSIKFVALNLLDEASITRCAEAVGGVDVLINNAGISQIGASEDLPMEKVKELFQVNLFGLMKLTQAFLPGMRNRGEGFIINIGSLAGRFAVPFQSSYVASKFALEGYSWSLRNEVMQYGIKVTVIEPNDINTTIEPELYVKQDSVYKPVIDRIVTNRKQHMKESPEPVVVADLVKTLLGKYYHHGNPKPFYAVGKNAGMLVFGKKVFSERFIEKQVRKNYRLDE